MNRQVLMIDYSGSKCITDDIVVAIGKAVMSALDDDIEVRLFASEDIDKLLLSQQSENKKQPSIIPVDLEKAVNFVQAAVGDPTKFDEDAYVKRLYKFAVTAMAAEDNTAELCKNAFSVIVKFNNVRSTGYYKAAIAYLRDRGFKSKIVTAINHLREILSV